MMAGWKTILFHWANGRTLPWKSSMQTDIHSVIYKCCFQNFVSYTDLTQKTFENAILIFNVQNWES